MLLFQKRFWPGLIDGSITVTFRRWQKARVRPGGRYRCHPIGVLEVDTIDVFDVENIDDADARRAGFGSRAELIEYIEGKTAGPVEAGARLYRIALHHGGDGDRVEGALDAALGDDDIAEIAERLSRLDARSDVGPWTAKTLAIIERRPREAAGRLAEELKRDKAEFKADVVKLKRLGLTQSFEVGYELSPRGRAYLAAISAKKKSKAKSKSKSKSTATTKAKTKTAKTAAGKRKG